jgi:hypothetical protein
MTIACDHADSPEFIAQVQTLADGLLRTHTPPVLIVVKIDNWFGPRWLRFSGKVLGALGVRKSRLTVPPFVPNRVVSQLKFVGPLYDEVVRTKPIHVQTGSTTALQRYVADVAPGAMIVWYSGHSNKSGQGSMMAYVPTPGEYWPLYVRWANRDSWRVVETIEITSEDVHRLSRQDPMPTADRLSDASPTV